MDPVTRYPFNSDAAVRVFKVHYHFPDGSFEYPTAYLCATVRQEACFIGSDRHVLMNCRRRLAQTSEYSVIAAGNQA